MKPDGTLTGMTLAQRSELLKLARARDLARRGSELPPIGRAARDGRLPLSFAQQRLWFVEQLGNLGSTYHIPRRLRLSGELDRAALARALDAIVARHEALRTTFAQVDGVPEQRIAPADAGFHLVEYDLRDRADANAELERLIAAEMAAPFDLEHGPLIRARLILLAEDDCVLALTMHHIVSDAWSMGVLTRELSALYEAFKRGEPDPLPELPVQYADYAAWQRQWVDGDVLRDQTAYWTRMLAGAPELLDVPTDRPRPARMDPAGAIVGLALDEELTAGLKALSRRHGTTLFMTVLAGWAVVLARLSGREDVVVGTPSAGRGRREIEGLIGFFVNTLALRMDLSGAPTVAELLGRVKARALEAQQHQDIPFEQVVERVDPVRSLAHHPLFQALFAWQSATEGGRQLSLSGVDMSGVGTVAAQVSATLDLSLSLREAGDRVVGGLRYAAALFDRETVERYAGYLRRVLEQMAADDGQRVDQLTLMPAEERVRVLEEWNQTEADYAGPACIHMLFEAQVARTPDAVAVTFVGDHLTYAELDQRANRLAHHLRSLGVGPEVRVGISLERGPEMMTGLLAILKAGGAYIPMDPSYPAERLAYMLEDSAPAVLVINGGQGAQSGIPVVDLADASPWAHLPGTPPAVPDLTPDSPCYVIYTSGSTGRPKGVVNHHRSVANLLAWSQQRWQLQPGESVLQRISFSFDVSVRELFWPLTAGARIVMAGPGGHGDPDHVVDLIRREKIGTAHLPGLLRAFVEHPEASSCTSLVRVMNGGEALAPSIARRFGELLPDAALYQMYGPTETTVASSGLRWTLDVEGTVAPIGQPIGNTKIYVLDARGEPVPTGVAGEICIGGAGVARGYLDRPEATAERFTADPFSQQPGARLYRTGDAGRWRADGTLEFLGRGDGQVKVRGYRIETGEIETRLTELPGVRAAVVMAREDTGGEKRLVAYVVGDEVGADALRTHLAGSLPGYMVPAAYVRLEEFPLTPNGKVDRKALPAPEGEAYTARAYEPPAGDVEEILAGIWAEVLGVERVGRRDQFFDLGGHSLLAVQVISRVRQALGVKVALGELFTRPVLAEFARGLETSARAELPPIERADREGRLPLSFAQQRLWFLEQLGDLGSTYHMHARLRLRGELDRAAMVGALDGLVARHEALRTTFAEVDGLPEQRIAPADVGFHLVEHDLSDHAVDDATGLADAHAELRRLLAEEAGTRFDLEHGPLIRGRLIRLAADDHVLVVTMHHIVSDGWSMGVLTGELSALYAARHEGRDAGLAPLPVQYADYAAWQRRWVEGDILREQADYWTRTLRGAPELLALPTDYPRPAQMDPRGARLNVALDEQLTAGLAALSRRHGTTLFMTLLAGWGVVLSRLSGQADVVIGTPTAGRGRREIEGLIGFFVNTLALRVELSGAPTVAELLERVKVRALESQHHQDIPFEQVVELVAPARSLSHSPLFQVMFAWQNTPRGGLELPGLTLGRVDAMEDRGVAKQDLGLTLGEVNGRIIGNVTYATSLFTHDTMERWLGYLRRVLEEMVADEHQPIAQLPMLPPAERALVLEEWNRTEAEYERESLAHELFQRQAERAPDALALACGTDHLTYAELNARANRLAHHLRSLGVGADTRVAISVERGPEMVIALLAVLKAGGAYVPLDPNYPEQRLRWMMEDSAPALLLTRGSLAARFADSGVPLIDLADDTPWSGAPATDPERGGLRPEHPAYLIYTSGSTGRPKGAIVQHRNVAGMVAAQQRSLPLEPESRVLQFASFSFDGHVYEVFLALARGASLHLSAQPGPLAGDDLVRIVADAGITHAILPPAVLAALPEDERLPSIRTLIVSGDAPPAELMARWSAGRRLINGYGPTEATVCTTLHDYVPGGSAVPPIGRPVANVRVYLLDAAGGPVPLGTAGELYIGGATVGRGYWRRAALTAERFVPDPFGAEPGARLYRTGDLARWNAEGELEFAGRVDAQVKVRGFRVELGEIEARLLEHPGIEETVVVASLEEGGAAKRLVAYWVGGAAEPEALRTHLLERLPDYMVPAAYVRLDALPLTPNGKVDRATLPAPDDDAFARRGYEAPVGELENALAAVWAEVLGVERVGRNDGFFELGGHSLLAVTLIVRMRAQGLRADVRALFATPTLAEFAAALGTAPEEVAVPANLIRTAAARAAAPDDEDVEVLL
ncbi:non-ribosomal peptide synthetase [Longimicrobium terrae]|uniref:Amino acid adenylation domain-containing protein n=1 Tax=Longimicrobium terrae TaxID=1639882 RepID=A0A841GUI5_9BACT|nr:non-ribosomal peptide synthetase [Longimicrobium terrae]MBB4636054.1 amino acid adenylation domain-containing protein [Longimicrobium terrae]MBB6070449.1 amino acid adenylation domain-containing protein [Longimicrobium terrae]NNC33226.1 amino acid adenylation domain-containing protein [Longimicrobium terrae]